MNQPARSEFWILTVHFYPRTAEAGVPPFEPTGFPEDSGKNPAYYRSHAFYFQAPPSRADFIAVCRQYLPWTSTWDADLFPCLAGDASDWPMVDCMSKAGRSEIIDANGLKVGHLDVRKDDLYAAEGYDRANIAMTVDISEPWLNRVPLDRRSEAYMTVLDGENRIQEAVSKLPYGEQGKDTLSEGVRKLLTDKGFIGKGSRKKPAEAVAAVPDEPPASANFQALRRADPKALLLFRVGDGYEAYGDDAGIVASLFGVPVISLEGTGLNSFRFPAADLEANLAKVVAAGRRAAVCERVANAEAKGKAVERVVTAGAIPCT